MAENALALAAVEAAGGVMLPPDHERGWINRIQIRSGSSDRLYVVSQKVSDGTWGCSCPAWRTRRRCKHLDAMNPVLALFRRTTERTAIGGPS